MINMYAHTHQLAFVHDELQYETYPEKAEKLMAHLEKSAILAGEYYKLRCPIAAEAKKGKHGQTYIKL